MLKKLNILNDDALYQKLSTLPYNLKNELSDYVDILLEKNITEETKIHPKAGCMKGMFYISEDFNEPLEIFKEYMP